jgi:hypothetical protein
MGNGLSDHWLSLRCLYQIEIFLQFFKEARK